MNYYKITNEKEVHNGMKYKTGLNIDIVPFKPNGDCITGGIYYAREDILAFICYGPWIRQVTIPEDALVYENPGTPRKWKSNKVILGKRRKITASVIKELVEEGAICNSTILRSAALKGYINIFKQLLKLYDPRAEDSRMLLWAAKNNLFKIVKLLLPIYDPKVYDSMALRWAARYGHTETVKVLIPVCNPKAHNNAAIKWAASYGHVEVVRMLIPVSSRDAYTDALLLAAESGHAEVAILLWHLSDPENYDLKRAIELRNLEVIKLLVPDSDLKTSINETLTHATLTKTTGILKLQKL